MIKWLRVTDLFLKYAWNEGDTFAWACAFAIYPITVIIVIAVARAHGHKADDYLKPH